MNSNEDTTKADTLLNNVKTALNMADQALRLTRTAENGHGCSTAHLKLLREVLSYVEDPANELKGWSEPEGLVEVRSLVGELGREDEFVQRLKSTLSEGAWLNEGVECGRYMFAVYPLSLMCVDCAVTFATKPRTPSSIVIYLPCLKKLSRFACVRLLVAVSSVLLQRYSCSCMCISMPLSPTLVTGCASS